MVRALFPIGKTQWAKWGDDAREAYNAARALGSSHEAGVAEANAVQAKQIEKAETAKPAPAPKKPAAKRKILTKKVK